MTVNRSTLFLLVAIVCFAVGWLIEAGHNVFGSPPEWLFAGLIAALVSRLP